MGSLIYCISKVVVSVLNLQYAKGLPEMKVNCVDPCVIATVLNGFKGKLQVEEVKK